MIPYAGIRYLPHCVIRGMAVIGGNVLYFVPSVRKLLLANIRTAMPERTEKEVRAIARGSTFHLCMNILEYFWIHSDPERIRKWYIIGNRVDAELQAHVKAGDRMVFVTPHLGCWEACGVVAPFYSGVDLVAIAKPMRNPYLNNLLNQGGRERNKGLRIIFARGAIRAAVAALRSGSSIGTLIDQNTRVRDGGVFVRFFGLPVVSSKAPVSLKRLCDTEKMPCVILYATCVRESDGKIHARLEGLPKPFEEYADDREVMQALMDISERYIREFPEQYLWFYHRFQHIPQDLPEEERRRYPYYAKVPPASFFDVRAKKVRSK